MKCPSQLNGETFATYATQEQHELVKWAATNAHIAGIHATSAIKSLYEASGMHYATLSYEAPEICRMITEHRERAIKELLKALEIIGYAP